jgi:MFS family permease
MSFGCTIAGGISNKITPKWTLVIGAAFYTPYAAGLYCNNRYGNEWFMLLGAALCGIGASLLWASEAAIAVGYPEESKRGRYVGIVWSPSLYYSCVSSPSSSFSQILAKTC